MAILVACSGGDDQPASTTSAEPASAIATEAPPALGQGEYIEVICGRAVEASSIAFAAFLQASRGYEGASGDPIAEAAAVAEWALVSAQAWQAVGEWSRTITAPPALADFHAELDGILFTIVLDRAQLAVELQEADQSSDVWIEAQQAWALTLLEPLSFIPAGALIPAPVFREFVVQPCEPLVVARSEVAAASDTAPSLYAAQTCWLHGLGWEQQQLSFQDLARIPEQASTIEEFRLAISTFTRQEERTQILLGLGLQAIVPPEDLIDLHTALADNSTARLVATFAAEQAVAAAANADALDAVLDDLLAQFVSEAEALMRIRDAAPAEVRSALDAHAACGALDGRELAFYGALTG